MRASADFFVPSVLHRVACSRSIQIEQQSDECQSLMPRKLNDVLGDFLDTGCHDGCLRKMVRPARFERATFRFGGEYSIQLSYGRLDGGRIVPAAAGLRPAHRLVERKSDNSRQYAGFQWRRAAPDGDGRTNKRVASVIAATRP